LAVGGANVAGPSRQIAMEQDETTRFKQWLDTHTQTASG